MDSKKIKILKERIRIYGRKKIVRELKLKPGTLGAYLTEWLTMPDSVYARAVEILDKAQI